MKQYSGNSKIPGIILLISLLVFTACAEENKSNIDLDNKSLAPRLSGLDILHYPVTTNSPEAQKFFNQGLALAYGFNHAEAYRSFRECARLDPNCAMCYWGAAFVLGPNINASMSAENVPKAWSAVLKALKLSEEDFVKTSEKEKDLISALSRRYAVAPPADRSDLDKAFAGAMRELTRKYADDVFVLTLAGEALMDLHPWDFYTQDGKPREWTGEILEVLRAALELDEKHIGANHLYIHAVEASDKPQLGLPSADNLRDIIPGAGHLVHMPSHTYIRTGAYFDAYKVNKLATKSDESYFGQLEDQGFDIADPAYRYAYYPHNYHYQMFAASMIGNRNKALMAAESTRKAVSSTVGTELMREYGWSTLQHFYSIPVFAMIRFGMWDEILAEHIPDIELLYPRAVLHYGRGLAFAHKEEIAKAGAELKKLKVIMANRDLEKMTIWDLNSGEKLMTIAENVLSGEISAKQGNYDTAISYLKTAMEIDETLTYDEPPAWLNPTHHRLGALLLDAGKPKEAEEVYLRELKRFPENGWSLMGLKLSLEAQGKNKRSRDIQARFEKAWQHADVEIAGSLIR